MRLPYSYKSLVVITGVLLFIGFGAVFNSAQAADLSDSIIKAKESLNKEQEKQVDSFIKQQLKNFNENNDNKQISNVRAQLLAPLKATNTGSGFSQDYSNMLVSPLEKKLSNDNLGVRLNAIIIIAQLDLEAKKLLPPATKALNDKSPAVRYWGAKTITRLATSESKSLSKKQTEKIKAILKKQISDESSAPVLGSILAAMAATGGAKGRESVLKALESRIKYHKDHPKASYLAAQTALRQIYINLVKEASNDKDISIQLKQLTQITVKYYVLAAKQLQENHKKLSEKQIGNRLAIINMADHVLRYAITKKEESPTAPGSIKNAVKNKDWDSINKVANSWKDIFK